MFTRDKETYAAFKTTPWAEKTAALFAKYCDLGEPTDRSEIVNDRDINRLWINLFARYLEGRDEAVRALVMGAPFVSTRCK